MDKIRVGFIGFNNMSWMGGINYLKNLLFSLSLSGSQKIEPYIFFEKNADPSVVKIFEELATCVFLTYNSPVTFSQKLLMKLTEKNYLLNHYLKEYKIDVISHMIFNEKGLKTKIIGWIPDFQHLHLPHMFSENELRERNLNFREIILGSDRMIVSSNDALKDCIKFEPSGKDKVRLLHFVSQVKTDVYVDDQGITKSVFTKYNISGRYFYLPNQFWRHKNHTVVIKAVAVLKNEGTDVKVLCSGNIKALENREYIESLQQLMKELHIEDNMTFLGVISYPEVLVLMRNSVSVINPSYFEGWSSSVEECKSIGKNMIVSELPVHKEQDPPETLYFNPDDENDLAEKMKLKLRLFQGGPDYNLESVAKENLRERTLVFAQTYESLVLDLFN
jgi:glycosyltransferase involved in cell wall biosynthesis